MMRKEIAAAAEKESRPKQACSYISLLGWESFIHAHSRATVAPVFQIDGHGARFCGEI